MKRFKHQPMVVSARPVAKDNFIPAFLRGLVDGLSAPTRIFEQRRIRVEYICFDSMKYAWNRVGTSLNEAFDEFEKEAGNGEQEIPKERTGARTQARHRTAQSISQAS